ncbi:hypothetical protein FACS189485_13450 [Spirochaetia bacterium]|nr:hypothetical protein FACS189485_13450 [Spirochaetia bacterium]
MPLAALLIVLLFCGCGDSLGETRLVIEFPDLPPAWAEFFGPPQWRVEWINPAGIRESLETRAPGEGVEVNIHPTMASPVLAWPFWPARGLSPGIFRPAGAIFPFDAGRGYLHLSWQGGVDAFFYHALLREAASAPGTGVRVPQNFDWPRFRELFGDPGVSAEVRADPWIADLGDIAARVVKSGFDKRRFKPAPREKLQIPVSKGPWIGTSPFASPLFFEDGIPVFLVRLGTESDTWYSAEGILRCAGKTWIFYPLVFYPLNHEVSL